MCTNIGKIEVCIKLFYHIDLVHRSNTSGTEIKHFWIRCDQTSSSAFLVVLGRRRPIRPPPTSRVATANIGTAQDVSTK